MVVPSGPVQLYCNMLVGCIRTSGGPIEMPIPTHTTDTRYPYLLVVEWMGMGGQHQGKWVMGSPVVAQVRVWSKDSTAYITPSRYYGLYSVPDLHASIQGPVYPVHSSRLVLRRSHPPSGHSSEVSKRQAGRDLVVLPAFFFLDRAMPLSDWE